MHFEPHLLKCSLSLNLIPETFASLFLFLKPLARWRQGPWHSHLHGAVWAPSKGWQVKVTQADTVPCMGSNPVRCSLQLSPGPC